MPASQFKVRRDPSCRTGTAAVIAPLAAPWRRWIRVLDRISAACCV